MMILKENLPLHIYFARSLRQTQTLEEKLMWEQVRGRKLAGYKFLRQHPIMVKEGFNKNAFYIADFYCAEKKLVIEIDGLIHAFQIDVDTARDAVMTSIGLRILRIKNEEINNNIYAAFIRIKNMLKE